MLVTSDVSPRLLAGPLRRRKPPSSWIDWSDWWKCPCEWLSFPLFTCKLQVVAGLDFTATGCISGRRENAQLNVYLELMHTASLRCLPADLAGPRRPTKLPHASRSGSAEPCRPHCVSVLFLFRQRVLAPGSWREAEAAAAVAMCKARAAAIISTRRLNDSTQRGFRSVIAVSNSYLPCYTIN